MKKLWVLLFLVLFGCSDIGFDTVTSINLNKFDKKEVAFYQMFSIKSDGVYTVSIRFFRPKDDGDDWEFMTWLGYSVREDGLYIDSGVPIYTYFELINQHGEKIFKSVKNNPTTNAISYGRIAVLEKAYLKTGNYKIMFYARQKNPIFAATNAQLNIGNAPLGKD